MDKIKVRSVDAATAANEMVFDVNSLLDKLFKLIPADDILALEPNQYSQLRELLDDGKCMLSTCMTYYVGIAKKQREMDQKLDDIKKMLEEMKCKE